MARPSTFDSAVFLQSATENAVRVWSSIQLVTYINRVDTDELVRSCAIAEAEKRGLYNNAKNVEIPVAETQPGQ